MDDLLFQPVDVYQVIDYLLSIAYMPSTLKDKFPVPVKEERN
jgi:hypothetical protein